MKENKKNIIFLGVLNSAIEGFFYALKTERNFKIHIFIAICVITGSLFLKIPLSEFLIILIFISLVFGAEIINTSIENFSNLFTIENHKEIKKIKDIAASSVLVASFFSFIGGYLIFVKYFPSGWRNIFENIANSQWHITFIALVIVISLAILLKFSIEKEFSLSGGMPSIHSGIAFSIWTTISILTFKEFPIISFLVLILAIWVAESRISKTIHKVNEVIIGGIIGILLTILIFQVFWR